MFESLFSFVSSISSLIIDEAREKPPQDARDVFSRAKTEWEWSLGNRSEHVLHSALPLGATKAPGNVYTPLPDERHTRLLKIFPQPLSSPKKFICELIPIPIHDPDIPYIAISYTWGDSTIVDYLICGRNRIGIGRSVYTVLDTLLEDGEMLYLWIDAICINQSDLKEKASQVRRMRDIYKNAAHVVVNLGESSPETDLGMDLVYPLNTAFREEQKGKAVSITRPTDESWAALGEVLRHPWFGRVWVIQEVAVGPAPLLVCGNRAVDWDTFFFVIYKIMSTGIESVLRGPSKNSNDPPPPTPHGLVNLPTMNEARCVQQQNEHEPFQLALMGMYHFNATDPRDKVFALLGLAKDTDDEALMPDYDEATSVQHVYEKTARHLLLRDSHIYILHKAGIGFPRPVGDLPSWVPDWTSQANLSFGSLVRTVPFEAAGKSLPKVCPTSSENSIAIEGVKVDTIARMTIARPRAPLGGDSTAVAMYRLEDYRWLLEVEELIREMKSRPLSSLNSIIEFHRRGFGESWDEALWRTLIGNMKAYGVGTAPPEYGQHFQPWRDTLERLSSAVSQEPWELVPPYSSPEEGVGIESYNTSCVGAAENRRFFSTASGYIGLTSPGTRVGDTVVLFLGGITPFVVRKNGSAHDYTLVGEAYVHNIMNGEAMASGVVETFVLT